DRTALPLRTGRSAAGVRGRQRPTRPLAGVAVDPGRPRRAGVDGRPLDQPGERAGALMGLWVRSGGPADEQRRPRRRLTVRPRFVVAAVALLIVVNLLIIEAYANARFVPDPKGAEGGPQKTVPAPVVSGGPIVGHNGSYRMPDRTVALTFDDGPDPTWTPRILDVLARHHVPATFFVVGSQGGAPP